MAHLSESFKPERDHPFIYPNSDVILRSSDGEDFCAHTMILSVASAFFADMFMLPQPSSDEKKHEEKPVVDMMEDARTLECLLRLVYPVADPVLDTLSSATLVLAAALKYQMDEAISIVRAMFAAYTKSEPVRTYAMAIKHGWKEEAKAAARVALRYPLIGPALDELKDIPALSYHNLLQYHSESQSRAGDMLTDMTWIPEGLPQFAKDSEDAKNITWSASTVPLWFGCSLCEKSSVRSSHKQGWSRAWWWDYMENSVDKLKNTPYGACCTERDTVEEAIRQASRCNRCGMAYNIKAFRAFVAFFAAAVEKRIDEVYVIDKHNQQCG
jgi:hypothetical protein